MADAEKPSTPIKAPAGAPPEYPTTARPLDFEDEPLETGAAASQPTSRTNTAAHAEDVAPPKPPRPLSPQQQAENTLKEAFPTIDATVVRAVLAASGGRVEPAFNALLGMTDPDSQKEPSPPAKPPRPTQTATGPTSTAQRQLEADEMYARQLAEHYGGATSSRGSRTTSARTRDPQVPRQKKEMGLKPNELYDDRDHSFFDDDLPVIRDNIRKGFLETQSKVNSWVQTFKKKLDGEDDGEFGNQPPRPAQGYQGGGQNYGTRRSGEIGRRSADRERYDADPQVLGDDFSTLELRDSEAPQRRSNRPLANPDLFKPTPPAPNNRRVSFQDGPPEEINDLYRASPDQTTQPSSTGNKASKWQPLSAVDPSPVADNDPFSLGDSDDEKDAKNKDGKGDEAERLKKATAEAMSGEIGSGSKEPGGTKPGET